MSNTLYQLITTLADGRFHSGEALGLSLGIGRAAVWKSLQQLSSLGLELHAVNGRGYRLSKAIDLLDTKKIEGYLHDDGFKPQLDLSLFSSIDSTSKFLKDAADEGAPSAAVYLTEYQSQGRGRRGRYWHSPYGSNIYFSLLWRFNDGMIRLGGLSLVVAVAMMRSFEQLGATGLGIKWPNDIITNSGKLAGILVDVAGESSGPCHAVIGIGVNYAMSPSVGRDIDQAWTQLSDCGVKAGRNQVVANLLMNLYNVITLYEKDGFDAFRKEWERWDMLRDHPVNILLSNETRNGVARGINESGMLQVEHGGVIRHYAAGEVSLRKDCG